MMRVFVGQRHLLAKTISLSTRTRMEHRRRYFSNSMTTTVNESKSASEYEYENNRLDPVVDQCCTVSNLDWDDRIQLQSMWSNKAKGWQVDVEWKETPQHYGIGLFARQDIPAGSILRIGIMGQNLVPLTCVADIEAFCQQDESRLRYVKDYLWGFHYVTDEQGYKIQGVVPAAVAAAPTSPTTTNSDAVDNDGPHNHDDHDDDDDCFFGMWIPGNGLNHSGQPNTVYRKTKNGINLVALTNVLAGDELVDDYRRHGTAPTWLKDFATHHHVTLNFHNCNDFV